MAFLKKLKKGGLARWAIYNATQNDSFTVPRGFQILNAYTESLATTVTGNITIGISADTTNSSSYGISRFIGHFCNFF